MNIKNSVIYSLLLLMTFIVWSQSGDSIRVYQVIQSVKQNGSCSQERFEEGYKLSNQFDRPNWKFDVLVEYGTCIKESQPQLAIEKLLEAHQITLSMTEILVSKMVLFDIAQLYHYKEKSYKLAISRYLECEEYVTQEGVPDMYTIHFELIDAAIKSKNDSLASLYLEKSWNHARSENNDQFLLKTGGLQIDLDKKNHDYKGVITHCELLLPYLKSPVRQRRNFELQGYAYLKLGEQEADFEQAKLAFKKAEYFYGKAMKIAEDTGSGDLYNIYYSLALINQHLADKDEAMKYYGQLLEVANSPDQKAQGYLSKARAFYSFREMAQYSEWPVQDARIENAKGLKQIAMVNDSLTQKRLEYEHYKTEFLIAGYEGEDDYERQAYAKMIEIKNYLEKAKNKEIQEEIEIREKEFALEEFEKQIAIQQGRYDVERAKRNEAEERALRSEEERKKKHAELETLAERSRRLVVEKERQEARLEAAEQRAQKNEEERKKIEAQKDASEQARKKQEARSEKLIAEKAKDKALANEAIQRAAKDKATYTVSRQRFILFGLVVILGLSIYFLQRIRKQKKVIEENKKEIEHEKERSENLLLSILPHSVAEELKTHQAAEPKHYDQVSVLFSDFKGFTRFSESLTPTDLLKRLNIFFAKFDEISNANNLERIKTIGDAYMAAGGLPEENRTNAIDAVKAALQIQMALRDEKFKLGIPEGDWEMRLGVHTGPVVAGVVGTTKFAYDIWGDAVNIASRLESNSEAGQVNISKDTYELIKDHYDCKYRGEIEIKNRGKIDMYFVVGPK